MRSDNGTPAFTEAVPVAQNSLSGLSNPERLAGFDDAGIVVSPESLPFKTVRPNKEIRSTRNLIKIGYLLGYKQSSSALLTVGA